MDYTISEPSAEEPGRPAQPAVPRSIDDLHDIKKLLLKLIEQTPPPRPRGWKAWLAFWTGHGDRTLHEFTLERRVLDLRDMLDERDRLYREAVASLNAVRAENEFEKRRWQAEITAAKREVELLAAIHERDMLRVQAEQAEYAQRIASSQKGAEQ